MSYYHIYIQINFLAKKNTQTFSWKFTEQWEHFLTWGKAYMAPCTVLHLNPSIEFSVSATSLARLDIDTIDCLLVMVQRFWLIRNKDQPLETGWGHNNNSYSSLETFDSSLNLSSRIPSSALPAWMVNIYSNHNNKQQQQQQFTVKRTWT